MTFLEKKREVEHKNYFYLKNSFISFIYERNGRVENSHSIFLGLGSKLDSALSCSPAIIFYLLNIGGKGIIGNITFIKKLKNSYEVEKNRG